MERPALHLDLVRFTDPGTSEQQTFNSLNFFNSTSPKICVTDAGAHDDDGNRIYSGEKGITASISDGGLVVRIIPGDSGIDVSGYTNVLTCIHHPE